MNYTHESEINIEKDRELTNQLIAQYISLVIQMFVSYGILFLANQYLISTIILF